jgi:ubiquinone/menaquinone biosynthesis C-methylase UbiE
MSDFALTIIFLAGLVFVVWRLLSRRASLPCPSWLSWMVELDNPFAKDHNAASIVRRLDVRPGMRILDAGCGPGRLTVPLARAVGPEGRIDAVDIQPQMLDQARTRVSAAELTNVDFIEHALGSGGLADGVYDRATLVTVLGEISDRRAALIEIFRSLKPGGTLSVTEILFDPHYQRRATVELLAREAGFVPTLFIRNAVAYTIHLLRPVA